MTEAPRLARLRPRLRRRPVRLTDTGMHTRSRLRTGLAATSLIVLSACESHDLTRPASGNTTYRWALIFISAALLVATVTWLTVRPFVDESDPVRVQVVGCALLVALGYAVLVGAAYFLTLQLRIDQLQRQFGGCVEVPLADRPESLVQLTCGSMETWYQFPALGFALIAAVPLGIGLVLLRYRGGSPARSSTVVE